MTRPALRYQAVRDELLANPKVWLVTGAAGFIGSNLVEELLGLNQTVVGLDNFATGHQENLDDAVAGEWGREGSFRFIRGDIRDRDTCHYACEGVDYVLHQAALASVPRSIDDPTTTNEVNVDGFLNILAATRDNGVRRVVYASSSSVYGDATAIPQVEENVGRPLSPYGASKATNELYAAAFQRSYGLEVVGLRYFNVFGRRQDPNGAYAAVIPRWIANLIAGDPCHVFGDGESSRDFCHIANAVQANILAATSAEVSDGGDVYNVACGEETTLNELFRMIRLGLAGWRPRLAKATPVYEAPRLGDIRRSLADIDKARRQLGYEPTHSIALGLGLAIEWYALRAAARTATPAEAVPAVGVA